MESFAIFSESGLSCVLLPNFVKWLIIAVVLAAMAAMMVAVNDRASRVEMPMPDNSLGIYRQTPATGK